MNHPALRVSCPDCLSQAGYACTDWNARNFSRKKVKAHPARVVKSFERFVVQKKV